MRMIRVRTYISDERTEDDLRSIANQVAADAEWRFDVKGSAIIPQHGRWKGKVEPGYIVEVVVEEWQWTLNRMAYTKRLAQDLDTLGMTALVTAEPIAEAIECYVEEEEDEETAYLRHTPITRGEETT